MSNIAPELEAYSVNKIKQMFGVAHSTIQAEIACGILPAFRVGRSIRVLRKDLEEYIEAKRVESVFFKRIKPDYYGGCSPEIRKLADEYLKPKRKAQ